MIRARARVPTELLGIRGPNGQARARVLAKLLGLGSQPSGEGSGPNRGASSEVEVMGLLLNEGLRALGGLRSLTIEYDFLLSS